MPPDNTGEIQGRRFQKGQSGNPRGRPKGSRNKATLAVQKLLDGEAEAITRKIIDKAKEGDMKAAQLCIERLLPPRRDHVVGFPLPPITKPEDAPAAFNAIAAAIASGQLAISDAAEVGKLIEGYVRAVEATDLAARLADVEKRLGIGGNAIKRVV